MKFLFSCAFARMAALAGAAFVVAGCAAPTHPGASASAAMGDPLVQSSWQLARWTMANGAARLLPQPPAARPVTLTFTREGGSPRASGFAGCNRYSANYVYARGLLIVKAPLSTRMGCASADHARLEADYLTALTRIASSTLDAQPAARVLTLTTTDGDVLTFERTQDPIAGGVGNTKLVYVAAGTAQCTAGAMRTQCLQVRDHPSQPWQLWYGGIRGFQPEPGIAYRLRVVEVPVAAPPADGASVEWVLDAVIEQTVVNPQPLPR